MPSATRRHKSVSLAPETYELMERTRKEIPVPLSQSQVLHLAILALRALDDPMDAAKHDKKE